MRDLNYRSAAFDKLMPLHLQVDRHGCIAHAGPTLQKILGDDFIKGRPVSEVFELRRPTRIASHAELVATMGENIHLRMVNGAGTQLKGMAIENPGTYGLLLNLAFGISVVDAVRQYNLTISDFASTDLTVEMLYLVEAKSAVMAETLELNMRLQSAKMEAEEQAYTDALTGLKNRRAMDHLLATTLHSAKPFTMMHLDLDFFKAVNDTLGHAAGDLVLEQVATVLNDVTRSDDVVARVGGDEFVLLFVGDLKFEVIDRLCTRIISRLEEPVEFDGQPCQISGSIGIVQSKMYDAPNAEKMLHDADIALYASKHKGRACYTMYSDTLLENPENKEPPKGREDTAA